MEQARTRSVEAQHLFTLPEVTWADLAEPGAYVERGSGDLYRIPQEALIPGGSPIIHKESAGASRLGNAIRSEEHTSELQSPDHLVCRLLLEKKKKKNTKKED